MKMAAFKNTTPATIPQISDISQWTSESTIVASKIPIISTDFPPDCYNRITACVIEGVQTAVGEIEPRTPR
jgi:hypothetical protein